LPLEVITQRNFVADYSTEVEIYWKNGKRVVDFLLVLIELFSPAVMVEAL